MMLEAPNVDRSANLDNVIGDCVHLKRLVWHEPREESASGPACCKTIECEQFASRVLVCVGWVNDLLSMSHWKACWVHRCVGLVFMWRGSRITLSLSGRSDKLCFLIQVQDCVLIRVQVCVLTCFKTLSVTTCVGPYRDCGACDFMRVRCVELLAVTVSDCR